MPKLHWVLDILSAIGLLNTEQESLLHIFEELNFFSKSGLRQGYDMRTFESIRQKLRQF